MKYGALLVSLAAACGSTPSSNQPDASGIDASSADSAGPDAAIDATVDAAVDAPLDAIPPPSGPLSCPQPPCTLRVSVAGAGTQGNGSSSDLPTITGDGLLVAFVSTSSNLVSDDQNGEQDLFLRDLATNTTTRVSNGSTGEANGGASAGYITADGRYIAFSSNATNLAVGDTNAAMDAFVLDHSSTSITRINLTSQGQQASTGGGSSASGLSGDARYVLFTSYATNLAAGADTNGTLDLFLRDRMTSTTMRIAGASEPNSGTIGGVVANDGTSIAFYSFASNMVAGDTNNDTDVFVRDTATGSITLVSRATDGTQGNEGSYTPSLSANGRLVAFNSYSNNFTAADNNVYGDIYLRDLDTSTTTLITRGMGGASTNGTSVNPKLSADGRYVMFVSAASNLVPDDTNGVEDAFVFDRMTNTTVRVSVGDQGQQGNGQVFYASLSASGNAVVFTSAASNLVTGDTNNLPDVFVRYVSLPTVIR